VRADLDEEQHEHLHQPLGGPDVLAEHVAGRQAGRVPLVVLVPAALPTLGPGSRPWARTKLSAVVRQTLMIGSSFNLAEELGQHSPFDRRREQGRGLATGPAEA
jgi:hypothetical protein